MRYISLLLLITAISFTGFAQNKDAILGQWVNSTGEAHVEIYKKESKYFGKIVWLKAPKDEKGNAKTDIKNPDAKLKSRPILGMEMLKDFVFEDGKWTDGKIYDPKSGKTYSCNMNLKDNGDLNMRGYIGISIIGRSEVWKKVK
ncbi:uncharacterized protein (DUF2147 family) [Pedobacter cryoconitis]|uniref:Uncharacterized protein (DUF2147 family) n=1 Tax=Pedobacter cryoconitis TaxID=188932 RepID=A0A7W8YUI6_9SPHI|nr:DUF2147 domain-containing protein [Pedobacter cryoconitis]MBB5622081.1 uncharacterized protein (DUF2147 family) [Pedobacter cryoconitis]MBB5646861.1 uncharacterized protein (DUF2147 family) [Pedobacter cryoconitis]